METSRRKFLSDRVVHYFENVSSKSKKNTVRHFLSEGYARSTIYDILLRYSDRGNTDYRKPTSRKTSTAALKLAEKVRKLIEREPNISERLAAARLNISKGYLHEIKVKKLGIKSRTCKSFPNYVKNQSERAKTACRKIVEKSAPRNSGKTIILDDETYCPIDPQDIVGRKF